MTGRPGLLNLRGGWQRRGVGRTIISGRSRNMLISEELEALVWVLLGAGEGGEEELQPHELGEIRAVAKSGS